MRVKAAEEFRARGVTLNSFYVESISPTEETAKAIDARSAMGAIGDMGAYMQYQTAQAIRETAQKPGGGTAATGAELGAGLGMGEAMSKWSHNPCSPDRQLLQPRKSAARRRPLM